MEQRRREAELRERARRETQEAEERERLAALVNFPFIRDVGDGEDLILRHLNDLTRAEGVAQAKEDEKLMRAAGITEENVRFYQVLVGPRGTKVIAPIPAFPANQISENKVFQEKNIIAFGRKILKRK